MVYGNRYQGLNLNLLILSIVHRSGAVSWDLFIIIIIMIIIIITIITIITCYTLYMWVANNNSTVLFSNDNVFQQRFNLN